MKTENIDKEMLDTTDKETQSPVHRVFQKLIEIEHRNPEKARLIVENTEKKVHCCPKFIAKSYESDRFDRRMMQEFVEHKKASQHPSRKSSKVVTSHPDDKTSSYYAQVYNIDQEKSTHPNTKESWSYWKNDKDSDQEKTSTSCALKTILNSQYCGVACLVILFIISVLATLLFVCRPQLKINPEKSAYDMNKIKDILEDEDNLPDSVKFKRKLEDLINKNNDREDDEDTIVGYKVDKKYWDDSDARDIASLMNYDTAFVPDSPRRPQSSEGFIPPHPYLVPSNLSLNLREYTEHVACSSRFLYKHLV